MIHLQDHIESVIKEELEKNTQGINFDVSLFHSRIEEKLSKETNRDGTYIVDEKRYVPFIIQDIFGEYVNLPSKDIIEGTITSTLLVLSEHSDIDNTELEENLKNISQALEEFRKRNIGKSLPIGRVGYLIPDDYRLDVEMDSSTIVDNISVEFEVYEHSDQYIIKSEDEGTLGLRLNKEGNLQITRVIPLGYEEILSIPIETHKQYVVDLEYDSINDTLVVKLNEEEQTEVPISVDPIEATNLYTMVDFVGVIYSLYISSTNIKLEEDGEESGVLSWEVENEHLIMEIGTYGYITFEFQIPSPTTEQFIYGDKNYQEFMYVLTFVHARDSFIGNQVRYFIDDVEIFPMVRDSGLGTEMDSEQLINEKHNTGMVTDSVFTKEFTLHYSPRRKVMQIMKEITSPSRIQNKTYELKEIYPLFEREYNVIIQNAGLSPSLLSPFTYSISLFPSDKILYNE